MRPKRFATDRATTRSVQRHALKWLSDNEGYQPEAVVTLQPTSPFRSADHIVAMAMDHTTIWTSLCYKPKIAVIQSKAATTLASKTCCGE